MFPPLFCRWNPKYNCTLRHQPDCELESLLLEAVMWLKDCYTHPWLFQAAAGQLVINQGLVSHLRRIPLSESSGQCLRMSCITPGLSSLLLGAEAWSMWIPRELLPQQTFPPEKTDIKGTWSEAPTHCDCECTVSLNDALKTEHWCGSLPRGALLSLTNRNNNQRENFPRMMVFIWEWRSLAPGLFVP